MKKTTIEIELLSPTYLGGAYQQPEFRIPSIKGLLRFWLRAIAPDYSNLEPKVFGDTSNSGAAPISLRLGGEYKKPKVCHLAEQPPRSNSRPCTKHSFPGIDYLSFAMGMTGGKRDALSPHQRFTIECLERAKDLKRDVTGPFSMAWWAMTSMGGIGGRSRRGFGSLAITKVDSTWKVMKLLKQQSEAATVDNWWAIFNKGLKFVRKWFGIDHKDDHFHIGLGTRFLLLGASSGSGRGFGTWAHALNDFGSKLKDSRNDATPEQKAALGLPIEGKGLKVKAERHERGASPLVAKILRLDDEYYTLVTLTRSPVCEENDTLQIKKKKYPKKGRVDYSIIDTIYNDWSYQAIKKKVVK